MKTPFSILNIGVLAYLGLAVSIIFFIGVYAFAAPALFDLHNNIGPLVALVLMIGAPILLAYFVLATVITLMTKARAAAAGVRTTLH